MITTTRILADKALQKTCGQNCVDWAISMLELGYDGHYLTMLAGITPPFNHFELSDFRDRALRELKIPETNPNDSVTAYTAEILNSLLQNKTEISVSLAKIKEMCVKSDYQKNIYDFYLLYFAYTDLQESEMQWYWPNADRKNIVDIILQRAKDFLKSTGIA
jgi:hypothetical protein